MHEKLRFSALFGAIPGSYYGNGFETFLAENIIRYPEKTVMEYSVIGHLHIMLALIGIMITLIIGRWLNFKGILHKVAMPLMILGTIVLNLGVWGVVTPLEPIAHMIIYVGATPSMLAALLLLMTGFTRIVIVLSLLRQALDAFAAAQQFGQRGAPDDVAQCGLGGPCDRLHIILDFQRGFFGIIDYPEEDGIDVHGHRVGVDRDGSVPRLAGRESASGEGADLAHHRNLSGTRRPGARPSGDRARSSPPGIRGGADQRHVGGSLRGIPRRRAIVSRLASYSQSTSSNKAARNG
jgi:hypothetical protein